MAMEDRPVLQSSGELTMIEHTIEGEKKGDYFGCEHEELLQHAFTTGSAAETSGCHVDTDHLKNTNRALDFISVAL